LTLTFLLGCKAGFLLASALSFRIRRNAGFVFGSAASLFGLTLSVLLGCEAGFLPAPSSRFFFGLALSFRLRRNAGFLLGSVASVFGLTLSLLLGCEAGFRLPSSSRFLFGLALSSRLRNAGFLLRSAASVFGLTLSFLLGCEAGFRLPSSWPFLFGPALNFLLGREAGFVLGWAPSLLCHVETVAVGGSRKRCILIGNGAPVLGAAVRTLAPRRPPPCAHDQDQDCGRERETEPADHRKQSHDWNSLLLPAYGRASSFATTARAYAGVATNPCVCSEDRTGSPNLGHIVSNGHCEQWGARGRHVRCPCTTRFTCSARRRRAGTAA
jgi:hypothetical protein